MCSIVVHRGAEVVAMCTVGFPCSAIAWLIVNNDCCSSWADRMSPKVEFGSSKAMICGYGVVRVPWEEAVQCNLGIFQKAIPLVEGKVGRCRC